MVSLQRTGPRCSLILSLAGVLAFLGIRAVRRWKASRLDELTLAMTLDRHRPGTGQQIADVLQLPELLDDAESTASPAMVRLAVQRACGDLAELGLATRSGTGSERLHDGARVILLGLGFPLVLAAIAPRVARLSAARWLLGSSAAMAAEDIPDRDGVEQLGQVAGAAR